AIFEATLELIKEHGFHGTPMSLVAKNAGVAAGTIYHYFQGKDQLICELNFYNKSRIYEVIGDVFKEDLSYKEKFFQVWRRAYEFYINNTNVLIFFEQFINSPYNTNKCPNQFHGDLFNFFKQGVDSGEVKKVRPEVLLILTMGSITSTAKIRKFANVPLEEKELVQIVEILWEGISLKKN